MAKQQAAPTAKVKKKGRDNRIPSYRAKDDVVPYNLLTEAERIAEGSRPNFAVTPNFKKSEAERKAWKKVHSSAKGPTAAMPRRKKPELTYKLTVHLRNVKKDPEFKTTYTYYAKPSEVDTILFTFYGVGNQNLPENKKANILKCSYANRPYTIKQ